jgi:hypothetical protein
MDLPIVIRFATGRTFEITRTAACGQCQYFSTRLVKTISGDTVTHDGDTVSLHVPKMHQAFEELIMPFLLGYNIGEWTVPKKCIDMTEINSYGLNTWPYRFTNQPPDYLIKHTDSFSRTFECWLDADAITHNYSWVAGWEPVSDSTQYGRLLFHDLINPYQGDKVIESETDFYELVKASVEYYSGGPVLSDPEFEDLFASWITTDPFVVELISRNYR